jgi:pyridoxal phosphate enzyme (YggS family)
MIGHVQSRKAKLLNSNFALLHSIDRLKLARKINALNEQSNNILPVLLECNLSGEQSKWGWQMSDPDKWPSAMDEFSEIAAMETLHLRGLMTMAPLTANQSLLRVTFEKCRLLRDFLAERLDLGLPELSMGMSNDFKIAVEEGATLVRLGTAILGSRHSMG